MDILGIDVCKLRLDVALLVGDRCRQAGFDNTEAGFQQLRLWLDHHRPMLLKKSGMIEADERAEMGCTG